MTNPEERDQLLISSHDSQTLYNCSPMRANILTWYDFKKDASALEINPESQAITEFLQDAGLRVSAADEKTLFSISDKYDYVFLIGSVDDKLLTGAKACLKEDGTLFIAIANTDGLMFKNGVPKYLDGSSKNSSISYEGLVKLLKESHLENARWFYPYPDYRLATEIFSDDRLPDKGLVTGPSPSYQGDYIISIDEPAEFDLAVDQGRVPEVMNSFLAVWSKENTAAEKISYVKLNSHRAPEFRLLTILGEEAERAFVEKRAIDTRALSHLSKIADNYSLLAQHFTGLTFVPFEKTEKGVRFDFIEGRPFLGEVDYSDIESAVSVIEEKLTAIFSTCPENIRLFEITEDCRKIFGDFRPESLMGQCGLIVSNPDSIFDNFIEGESIYCLDYEWTFDFCLPLKYLKFRTLHYLYRRDQAEIEDCGMNEEKFLTQFGYSKDELSDCQAMELAFQQYVHGKDLRYIYLDHYKWRAWTREEWKREKSLTAKIKRKLHK